MREFIWLSEDSAIPCKLRSPAYNFLKGLRPHVHIVIRSPGAEQKFPGCGNSTMWQAFHDLDPAAIRKSGPMKDARYVAQGEKLIKHCMNEQQAKDVVAFVERSPEDSVVIVNCEAGISRSPGMVLAFRIHYGGDTEEVYKKAVPNKHVNAMMLEALRSIKPKAQ